MKLAAINGIVDLQTDASGLVAETTLESAVIISLLSDRRANTDDVLPDGATGDGVIPPDRRGWCGDALSEVSDFRIGSRLWLLSREKQTEETRKRAMEYAYESLEWLIEDGHVQSITLNAEWSTGGRLNMLIDLLVTAGGRFSVSLNDVLGEVHAI